MTTTNQSKKTIDSQTTEEVFILGAGFSKAIYGGMPTMDEISSEVRKRMENLGQPTADLLKLGNNIELWMTYLSQPQPWLKNYENDHNRSLAGQIRQQIREIIEERTSRAAQSKAPDWLDKLIKLWHERRSTVITLNYDTLVERATREFHIAEKIDRVLAQQMYPPYFSAIASRSGVGLWGEERIYTFTYLKLHGSVNWYYSGRDNFYGETIYFADVPPLGTDNSEQEKDFARLSNDKESLIIPPVNEKTTYFNNETVNGLWQAAGSALRNAKKIFVIGYSLPNSDIGMRLFLSNNLPISPITAYIVDRDSKVPSRYKEWLPNLIVNCDYAKGLNPVVKFVQHYSKICP